MKNKPLINGVTIKESKKAEDYYLQRELYPGLGLDIFQFTSVFPNNNRRMISIIEKWIELNEEHPEYTVDWIDLSDLNVIHFFYLCNNDGHRNINITKIEDTFKREFYIFNLSGEKIELIFDSENSSIFMNENVCILEVDEVKKFTFQTFRDIEYSFLTFFSYFLVPAL
ncbi:MAG: hypothetical protein LBR79_02590 [Oscillospiraceae bacterium]|nr:hypothetical protein [Oscillospiraceae bacterium]